MRAIFIDAYRHMDKVILWLKTPEENIRLERNFSVCIYLDYCKLALEVLRKNNISYNVTSKLTYEGKQRKVCAVRIDNISRFESIVKKLEYDAKHRLIMYNADIPPEQMFLYSNKIKPFTPVKIEGSRIIPLKDDIAIPLKKTEIEIIPARDIRADPCALTKGIIIDNQKIRGDENRILLEFSKKFISIDPDVILMDGAFSRLPYLAARLEHYKIHCPFHRWDSKPIRQRGGKTFFSYGRVMYRDFAVRLNGRFLVDSMTTIGSECDVDGIIELSNLSGTRFQQVASRSFGAAFQHALVAELVKRDYLVPFKEKPVDMPISMFHLMKFDRVGYSFDSITGLHHDVAEIDFSSLFPWIIYNYNISPEALFGGKPPYQQVPALPIKISLSRKGVVPTAIKPLLDRRMHYKKNPSSVNRARIQGLKWVLVTSYGYLRFREFKLGVATSHMAIGAFAREILMKAKEICEQHGYRIVHGIIDSLYIQKEAIREEDVKEICREIELETGVPVSFEGIFKWIVFLPSVNDIKRPVPTRYYGVFSNGEIKARGLEVRQSGTPKIIRQFQRRVLEIISRCDNKEEIASIFPYICQVLRKTVFMLPYMDAQLLSSFTRISKTEYENDIPQKLAVGLLREKGVKVLPGQKVCYIFGRRGIVLPEDYKGRPDAERYKRLLVRALFVLLQPFGFTKKQINNLTGYERQARLDDYNNVQKSKSVDFLCPPAGLITSGVSAEGEFTSFDIS
jgi:DNA polymerase elongation subunit (family B)